MPKFEIEYLDHVAIRVKDMDVSISWYEEVLGLEARQFEKWGSYPVFLLAGKTGIAIFPANLKDEASPLESKNVKIDHYAFYVSNKNFENAKHSFEEKNIAYRFQDHYYFHSIYLTDPDGHTVELTTRVSGVTS